MHEVSKKGPLDIVREIDATARRTDAVVQEYLDRNPDSLHTLAKELSGLNYAHPWAGQEINVYGTSLTISDDGEETVPYVLPADSRPTTTRGLYTGMTIRKLYDTEEDRYGYKLVHMIYIDSSDMELDDFGRLHQTHNYDYVCLGRSELTPVLPISAHSLDDLENDPVITAVDEIAFDEDADDCEVIMRLGDEVNEVLASEAIEFEVINLNHQRASYINALGLHEMIELETSDILVGSTEEHPGDFEYKALSSIGSIIPRFFQIAPGYDKLTGVDEPLRGGPPELYARIDFVDEKAMLLAALKDICDVKALMMV